MPYPGGRLGTINLPGGAFVADTYRVSAADTMKRYGVTATLVSTITPDKILWQGQVPIVGTLPDNTV